MTEIRIPVPRISAGLASNLLGVAGLLAIIFAVGALTSWKWGLLAAGVFSVALTVMAQSAAAQSGAAAAPVTRIDSKTVRAAEVPRSA